MMKIDKVLQEIRVAETGDLGNKLVVYLRGMLQVDPETYQDLAARVELLIDKTTAAIKRRSAN
jgi:hypothetical protein